jgi:uncharacterized membrane protein
MGTMGNQITNMTNPMDFVSGLSAATDGFLGHLILITFFIILLIAMKNFEFKRTFAASSFLTFLVAVLLFGMNLIPSWDLYISLTLAIIGGVALMLSD